MTDLEASISKRVDAYLGSQKFEKAIIYLDHTPKSPADHVTAGDFMIDMPWNGHIAFVDLEPGVNWGHTCLYLALQSDGDTVIQFPARMPPFIKDGNHDFRLLQRGSHAPEWAVFS
jgi:hypothetical protein